MIENNQKNPLIFRIDIFPENPSPPDVISFVICNISFLEALLIVLFSVEHCFEVSRNYYDDDLKTNTFMLLC